MALISGNRTSFLNGQYSGLTYDNTLDVMLHGYSWQLDQTRVINWSISDGWYGEYLYDLDGFQDIYQQAFDSIEQYIDVDFTYAGYFSDPATANNAGAEINLSFDSSGYYAPSWSWAVGFFPVPNDPYRGQIYFNINSDFNYLESYQKGSEGFFVILHEIGHTLGLKHPHDDGGTGRPTALEIDFRDEDIMTIMSYNDAAPENQLNWDPATPMVMDVLALQYVYGKNLETNAGDTNIRLDVTGHYETIWDPSGVDKLDQSSADEGWYIVMPYYTYSDLNPELVGYAHPMDAWDVDHYNDFYWLVGDYEHAKGSAYADEIEDNDFDNQIDAGAGNDWVSTYYGDDTLSGGAGYDTLYFYSSSTDFEFTALSDDWFELYSDVYGTKYVQGFETFDFDDVTLTLDELETSLGGTQELVTYEFTDGDDRIIGGAQHDSLEGGAGNDTLSGKDGNDHIDGGEGSDLLVGSDGRDTIYGRTGNDLIGGGLGNDRIEAGDGDDTIGSGKGNDTIYTGSGNDRVSASFGDDYISGISDSGQNSIAGSVGEDTIHASDWGDMIGGGYHNDEINGGYGDDTIGAGQQDDSVSGGRGNDIINGNNGHDTLSGGEGLDTINGGPGNDMISGDAGADTFTFLFNGTNEQDVVLDFDQFDGFYMPRVYGASATAKFSNLDISAIDYEGVASTLIEYKGHEIVLVDYTDTLTVDDFEFYTLE